MSKKHTITVDQIFNGKPLFHVESVIASQHSQHTSKELRLRVTINATSHHVDGMFQVSDCTKLPDRQILLITSNLTEAVEKYNEI